MKTMPDICHLWYATELSKAVKSTPERTPIHDQNCLATKQHTGVFGVLGAVGIGMVYLLQSVFGIDIFAQQGGRGCTGARVAPAKKFGLGQKL